MKTSTPYRQETTHYRQATREATKPTHFLGPCVAAFILLLPPLTLAFDAQSTQELSAYYRKGPFCSTARVYQLQFDAEHLTVTLSIDPRWAKSLDKSRPALRRRWFALHCPMPMLPPWGLLPDGSDILIKGTLPNLGDYVVSCREFNLEWQRQVDAENSKFRRKVDALLQRLGIAE